jgi:hypothetical protein
MLGNVSLNKRTFHFTKHSTNSHIFLYNHFHSLFQLWFYPSNDSPKKILIRRVSPQQKKDPQKNNREKREKEKKKEARIKSKKGETSYANIRARKAPWKEEDEKFKTSGRDLLKGMQNGYHTFLWCKNPIGGFTQIHLLFAFAPSSNPWFLPSHP